MARHRLSVSLGSPSLERRLIYNNPTLLRRVLCLTEPVHKGYPNETKLRDAPVCQNEVDHESNGARLHASSPQILNSSIWPSRGDYREFSTAKWSSARSPVCSGRAQPSDHFASGRRPNRSKNPRAPEGRPVSQDRAAEVRGRRANCPVAADGGERPQRMAVGVSQGGCSISCSLIAAATSSR
jgi:hypothetical protein